MLSRFLPSPCSSSVGCSGERVLQRPEPALPRSPGRSGCTRKLKGWQEALSPRGLGRRAGRSWPWYADSGLALCPHPFPGTPRGGFPYGRWSGERRQGAELLTCRPPDGRSLQPPLLKKEGALRRCTVCTWLKKARQEGKARRQWHPTPVLLPGKSHGWRSLVGCSPWGREESDTTERLHFDFSLSCIGEGNGNPLQCSCLENPKDRQPGGLPSMR